MHALLRGEDVDIAITRFSFERARAARIGDDAAGNYVGSRCTKQSEEAEALHEIDLREGYGEEVHLPTLWRQYPRIG